MSLSDPAAQRVSGSRIMIACAPKSGSTFIATVLRSYLDVPEVDVESYDWGTEHNLTADMLEELYEERYVLQMHMRPHASNVREMRKRRMALIVLWRNVADMLVSLDEHFCREGVDGPFCYVFDEAHYRTSDAQERYRYLIDYALPSYLAFYLSWRRHSASMVHYETMLTNQNEFFARMIGRFSTVDRKRLDDILAKKLPNTRFQFGLRGRSASAFSSATKEYLERKLEDHLERDQLAVLIDDLPWRERTWRLVRPAGSSAIYFVRGNRYSWVSDESWIHSRPFADQQVVHEIAEDELALLTEGQPIG